MEGVSSLDGKDILVVFPPEGKLCTTVRVLKTPKTESCVRKIYIPKSVAEMLEKLKASQNEMKNILGKDYQKYDLVMATDYGLPIGEAAIRKRFKKLIKDHDLPDVVFHSLRHTSVTYKLKLNGGDIKAVQGDSGHAQVNMVTDVYSHILDEDRKRNAELFEEAFYGKKKRPLTNERTLGIMGDETEGYYHIGERAKSMEKSNTREEILEAALDLFAVNGYEATSISQLADAVGIRKASLYSHFANKQDILDTIVETVLKGYADHSIFVRADWDDPRQDRHEGGRCG